MNEDIITVATADEAHLLEPGQWCEDASGETYCLVDTHKGFAQRMAMSKGGRAFTALDNLVYPLHLGDFIGDCEHRWGANEMGHCRRCGQVSEEPRPWHFTAEGMDVFRKAAEHNARIDAMHKPSDPCPPDLGDDAPGQVP